MEEGSKNAVDSIPFTTVELSVMRIICIRIKLFKVTN